MTHPRRLLAALVATAAAMAALAAPAADASPARSVRAPHDPPHLDVLVIGDSYSAGNGATDDAGAYSVYGPADCYRSRDVWGEKYAAGLRSQGYSVTLANHACSGGVTADVHAPRQMDGQSKTVLLPQGVTDPASADAWLGEHDPCNTGQFPDEEFWRYATTNVSPVTMTYTCTRFLRPQASFVTPRTDLVLFTMGGNDAGFTSIVTQCFALKSASGCQAAVDSARAKLPAIKDGLLQDVAALRAAGLRPDARIVQLGYPWLQVDNNYSIGLPPYAAGNAVRSMVSDGDAQLATVADAANVGHPGQMTFVAGVPEKFSGHEPDATTPVGNPARWVNQLGDGGVSHWYHPNRLGQQAYAELLLARGTFGAPTSDPAPTAHVRVRVGRKVVREGRPIVLRVRVRLSDHTRPSGRIVVRVSGHPRVVRKVRLGVARLGHRRIRVPGVAPGRHRLTVVYRDQRAAKVVRHKRARVLS